MNTSTPRREPRSRPFAVIYESACGLHRLGLIDALKMQEFADLCLTEWIPAAGKRDSIVDDEAGEG